MSGRKMLRQIHFWILAALGSVLLSGCSSEYLVLNPKGPVATTQYNLIVISAILCAIIIIPVFAITAFIVYRYRDTKDNKAPYKPEWSHNTLMEIIWWGIPVIIIAILGFFTWRDTYALKESPTPDVKPITIQVTNLDWKWMFTYPEQNIATVNYLEIPAGVPVRFQVSSDAPMNSFWVPELGGQIYAMAGMATELYLQADHPGEYQGFGANFTGTGFAHMQFTVDAKPQAEFDQWVTQVKNTTPAMTKEDYEVLRKPSLSDKKTYSAFPKGLFEEIVMKYSHGHDHTLNPDGKSMDHGSMNMDHSSMESGQQQQATTETHQMSDMSQMPAMNHNH